MKIKTLYLIMTASAKLQRFVSLINCICVAVVCLLLTVPQVTAAPARVRSPLLDPAPSSVDNGDGTMTYSVFVLVAAETGSAEQNKSYLYQMDFTVQSGSSVALALNSQQGSAVNTTSSTGSSVSTVYDVESGSVDIVYQFDNPNSLESYQIASGYTGGFKFINSYFPRRWGVYSGPSVFVHAWVPDGVSLINNLGSFYVDDWVDWSVDPIENMFRSHLDKPVADDFNRYIVAYNRKTKDGILIHFNSNVSGFFNTFIDQSLSTGSLTLSGDGSFVFPQGVETDISLEGFYDSTGSVYQGKLYSDQSTCEISFSISGGSLSGSVSGSFAQLVDGSRFAPEVDFSSGSESYSYKLPHLLYSNYGSIANHFNVYVSIYNLLDGSLINQYIFDSVNSSDSIDLDIGSPLSDISATHILTFGSLYKPDPAAGLNWGSVIWSVDPVVEHWRSDVSGKLDQIISLLRDSGSEEPTTINRNLASGLAEAEQYLEPPIDVKHEAEKVFNDSLDQVNQIKPVFNVINSGMSVFTSRPLLMVPIIVALSLGLLITIIGKHKSG